MNRTTLNRIDLAEKRTALVTSPTAEAAARGRAALQQLGVNLSKLTNDELARIEMLVNTWPDDGTAIPAAAIWACLGRG